MYFQFIMFEKYVQFMPAALQKVANSSNNESIRRAARGALWVVKTAPPVPVEPEKPDTPPPPGWYNLLKNNEKIK